LSENLKPPRGIISVSNGDILVVENGRNSITALWDDNKDGVSDSTERSTIASASHINHGIVVHQGYLYASSPTTVFRWPYTDGQRSNLGKPQIVIDSIPDHGHSTRTMVFDSMGRLYVQVGSGSNVDSNSARAAIRRFSLDTIPQSGIIFASGELFAHGMRNEVGLRFDKDGGLWGVENGVDDLAREPWGDIHKDNPAEELNYFGNEFTPAGLFYGYPYCFSEYLIYGSKGPGTQWVHPSFANDGIHTDAWCQNTSNVVPPAYSLPAHVAPLDILFFYGTNFSGVTPGDAFVTMHGSWNRSPPQGFKVIHVTFQNKKPVSWRPILYYNPKTDPHASSTIDTGSD